MFLVCMEFSKAVLRSGYWSKPLNVRLSKSNFRRHRPSKQMESIDSVPDVQYSFCLKIYCKDWENLVKLFQKPAREKQKQCVSVCVCIHLSVHAK